MNEIGFTSLPVPVSPKRSTGLSSDATCCAFCITYTIIEEVHAQTVYNWLQYFSPDALRQEFEENGFKIEEFFSDVTGKAFNSNSKGLAIVARRL